MTLSKTAPYQAKLGGAYAWFIWALAAAAFGYAFFHRVTPSVMVSDLMTDFAIGGAMLGTLSALYFYPYVILQVPLGALLETFGTRLLLSAALCLAGIGSVLFGIAESIELAYLGRFLIGVGSSVGFLGSLALASKWFPPHRYAFLTGLSMFTAMGSGMVAQAPLAYFIESFGWRSSLSTLGWAGFGLAVMIFLFVRNAPETPEGQITNDVKKRERAEKWSALWASLRAASTDSDVWKMSFVAATLSGPMLVLGGLWGTPYLMKAHDLARPDAAFLMSLLLLGWAISAPFCGWLSGKIGRSKPIVISGAIALCAMLTLLIFAPGLPLGTVVPILIAIGLSGGSMVTCFALVRDVMPVHKAGAATGIVNSMTVASGAVLQPLVGLALDILWAGDLKNGAPVYQASDYRIAFILVLIAALGGLIVAFRLRETPKA
jgi:MFS family permease